MLKFPIFLWRSCHKPCSHFSIHSLCSGIDPKDVIGVDFECSQLDKQDGAFELSKFVGLWFDPHDTKLSNRHAVKTDFLPQTFLAIVTQQSIISATIFFFLPSTCFFNSFIQLYGYLHMNL